MRLASFLPWVAMWISSVFVNVAALLAAMWFTFGGLGYRDRRVRLGATLLAAAVTFWLQPVVRTIYLGQVNLVLMAMIMWDLCQPSLLASGRRRWWKGALTGVAAGIKLVPLIFVPYLLITRRFREAVMTVAGFLVTVAIGFAVLPHDSSEWWLHGLFWSDGNRAGFEGWAGNQSLRAIITRFAGSVAAGQDPWMVAAVIAFILGMTAAYLVDRAGYPVPALLVTSLTGLLISPISWDHHWVWIALGVAVTGHYALAAVPARCPADRLRAVGPGRRDDLLLRRLAGRSVGERAEPRQLVPRLHLGAAQHQPRSCTREHGDQPSYVEYHWHGFQLLWGNAYIIAGVALLLIALWIGFRLRKRPPVAEVAEQEPLAATSTTGHPADRRCPPGWPGRSAQLGHERQPLTPWPAGSSLCRAPSRNGAWRDLIRPACDALGLTRSRHRLRRLVRLRPDRRCRYHDTSDPTSLRLSASITARSVERRAVRAARLAARDNGRYGVDQRGSRGAAAGVRGAARAHRR